VAASGENARSVGAVAPDTWLGLGFVALWGTGFIGAKFGLPWAGPFDFLALRFAIVSVLLLAVAFAFRAPWPAFGRDWIHIAIAGLLLHALYLGGVFAGIDAGVPAGITALIVGTQPVLTAFVVGPILGEHVRPLQWLGFALGFLGLVLVLWERLNLPGGESIEILALPLVSLLAITAGTIYQKRFCPALDLRSGTAIQYTVTAFALLPLALWIDHQPMQWTGEFIFALTWMTLVLSLGAVTLLYLLIRRGAASRVASLFYLVPPTVSLYAWLAFGETLGTAALLGMIVIATGVALVNRG
jgi:drug/metabolite transporter (DMT)-like permease